MSVSRQGSNVVVRGAVAGSVFPTSERDIGFPVLVDGTEKAAHVGGAIYGRALELRGDVRIDGPVVARGDMRLSPRDGVIRLQSGLTVNGSVNAAVDALSPGKTVRDAVANATVLIKGDVAVNQNIALSNAIVFGSVRAVNCTLESSLILGTCVVEEHLKVAMSSIGGYASRDVTFEGECALLHAIGESRSQPLFVPYEQPDGALVASDVRLYAAIRDHLTLMNRASTEPGGYPAYSRLYFESDWLAVDAMANPALEEGDGAALRKWVLSIGGRVADIGKISEAVASLARMLKCGFEFEHYHPAKRGRLLAAAVAGLTEEEAWILNSVCKEAA